MTISIQLDRTNTIKIKEYNSKNRENNNNEKWIHYKEIFFETFIEFCKGTNLHGFSQIVEEHKDVGHPKIMKFLERTSAIMWGTFVIVNLVFAIFLFEIVLQRYRNTPTITTVHSTNYPISEIKFPGIAICNVNCVWKPNTQLIRENLSAHNVSKELIGYFFGNVSAFVNFESIAEDLFAVIDILEHIYGYTPEKLMKKLAMPCNKFLIMCQWLGFKVDCSSIFKLMPTDLGFCCVFNYENTKIDEDKIKQINKSPDIHLGSAGEDFGLKVLIDIDQDNYVGARKFFYGSEIIVFDPDAYPQKHYISDIVQQEHGVSIGMKPSIFATSNDVQSFPIDLRDCLYDFERKLTVTSTYSFESCIVECRAMEAIARCNCLPFMYPHVVYPNSNGTIVRQCGFRDLECLKSNKHVFYSIKPPENMYAILNISKEGLDCDCLPSCDATTYDNEIYPIDRSVINNVTSKLDNPDYINRTALVNVYYKYITCTRYLRRIFMTWDDLLGSFGGIFGLCLGASVFSIAEIGYYFSISFLEKILLGKVKLNEQRRNEFAKTFMIQYCKPFTKSEDKEFCPNDIKKNLRNFKDLDSFIQGRKSIHDHSNEDGKY